MNTLLVTLLSILTSIGVNALLSAKGHGKSSYDRRINIVELSVSQARAKSMRAIGFCCPLVVLVPHNHPNPNAIWAVAALALLSSAAFFWMAAILARRIRISQEGVAVVGFQGWRLPWTELSEIRAVSPGMDFIAFVSKTGRTIAIDSSFEGWRDLIGLLPALTSGDEAAARMASEVITELNRWKTGPDRYSATRSSGPTHGSRTE